jgi:hypothetical protein
MNYDGAAIWHQLHTLALIFLEQWLKAGKQMNWIATGLDKQITAAKRKNLESLCKKFE